MNNKFLHYLLDIIMIVLTPFTFSSEVNSLIVGSERPLIDIFLIILGIAIIIFAIFDIYKINKTS